MKTLIASLLLLVCVSVFAFDVSLAWSPSPDSGVVGYFIYYGQTSGVYSASVFVGNVTNYTITNLAAGTWYFAATATNDSGYESAFSNEASTTLASNAAVVISTKIFGSGTWGSGIH